MSNCKDGDVRLEGGQTKYEGRVEICINKAWGTVCSYKLSHPPFTKSIYWNSVQANVVCRQLGHMEIGMLYNIVGSFGGACDHDVVLNIHHAQNKVKWWVLFFGINSPLQCQNKTGTSCNGFFTTKFTVIITVAIILRITLFQEFTVCLTTISRL